MLRGQVEDVKKGQQDLKKDIDRRFEQANENQKLLRADMDKCFEQVGCNKSGVSGVSIQDFSFCFK